MRDGHKNRLLPTSSNVASIARLCGWSLEFNEMTKQTEIQRDGVVVPEDDHENTALALLGDDIVRNGMTRERLWELVDAAARNNAYHPVRDWVESIPWDGTCRIKLLADTLHLKHPERAPLAHRLLHKWMLQAVAALFEPDGIAADGVLVLAGPQYKGKTYWVRHLLGVTGAVIAGISLDPENKDSVLKAIRCFIGELGELDATTRKADVAALKSFITDSVDEIRLPYARRAARFKRRTVFCATVNGTGFLVDDTGNRRFWVIEVTDCGSLDADTMQQVWAQYLRLYRQGERWYLEPELLKEINAQNKDYEQVDTLAERIAARYDWSGWDLAGLTPANRAQHPAIVWKTATELCIDVGIPEPKRSDATRAGSIARNLQCHHSATSAKNSATSAVLELLERRSDGVRLFAVPRALARR